MEKILLKILLLLFTAAGLVTAYTQFINVGQIKSENTAAIHGINENREIDGMTEKQIMAMLLADARHISLFVESIQKIPKDISNILGLHKFRLEEIFIIQNSILKSYPELYGMSVAFEPYMFKKEKRYFSSYLYRKDGRIIQTDLNGADYDYFTQNWYLQPKLMQKPIWTSPYYDKGGGDTYMTTYAVPFNIFDGEKEMFSGIVTIDVAIDWLVRHFLKNKTLPRNGAVILISAEGSILSAGNEDRTVNKTISSLAGRLNLPELKETGRAIQNGKHGSREIYSSHYNRNMMLYYTAIRANAWGLLYLIPDIPFTEADDGLLQGPANPDKESGKDERR